MRTEEYQAFKTWLIETNRLPDYTERQKNVLIKFGDFDPIATLFAVNKFLERYCATTSSLFDLIRLDQYNEIYEFRYHRLNRRTDEQTLLLSLSFEHLNKSFDLYEDYEATTSLSKISNAHTLYIHQGNIACLKHKHPIEDVAASIVTHSERSLLVHASRCQKCNITFFHKKAYLRLRKQYPYLVANFCELSSDGYTPVKAKTIADKSPLKLCGYSVKKNGLSDELRHSLLRNVICNGILSKTEIIQYLEYFIGFNGERGGMWDATCKWISDLDFVRNLDIENHPIVSIEKIKPYSKK